MRYSSLFILLWLFLNTCTVYAQGAQESIRVLNAEDLRFLQVARLQSFYFGKYVYCTDVNAYFDENVDRLEKYLAMNNDSIAVVKWSCKTTEICEFLTVLRYLGYENSRIMYDERYDSWTIKKSCVKRIARWLDRNARRITVEKINHCYLSRIYIPKEVVSSDYRVAILFIDFTPEKVHAYLHSRGLAYQEERSE